MILIFFFLSYSSYSRSMTSESLGLYLFGNFANWLSQDFARFISSIFFPTTIKVSFAHISQVPGSRRPYENGTPQEGKEWANLAYDRTFRFGERKHYIYTFLVLMVLVIYTLLRDRVGRGWRDRTRNGDKQLVGKRKRWREKRWNDGLCERRESVWRVELFYSLNIGPNQTPSTLCRAREYKCSPSRLYNHGSVKLTSQSCNQPAGNLGRTRDPSPITYRDVLEFSGGAWI